MNQRTEFVLQAQSTPNFRALCREYGISPKVGYKWRARFLQGGLDGMVEESRRPKKSPEGLSEEVVCRIVKFRERHPTWGARKLEELYRRAYGKPPSESSIKRVLERSGMVKKRRIRKAQEGGRLTSGVRAKAPNEVWTVDFKGWWYDAGGRCEPFTVRDEYSRYILEMRAMPNARTHSVQACLERLFERHGLPGAIRSDNGSPFASARSLLGLSQLSVWWVALGINLERGRPGCPQDNGGHERAHLDISREIEKVPYGDRQAAFDLWRNEFNQERPHDSLGMQFPCEVYKPSSRRYNGTPEQITYPGIDCRKVMQGGEISYAGAQYFITTALRGWEVGLKPAAEGRFDVKFANLVLGQIEPSSAAFLPVLSPKNSPQPSEHASR